MPPTFICWSHCKASALPGVFLPSFFGRLSLTGISQYYLSINDGLNMWMDQTWIIIQTWFTVYKQCQCTQWLRGDSYHVQICGSLLEVFNQRFAEVGQRYRQVIEVTNVSLTFNQLLGLGHDSRSSQDMRCFQLFFFGMSKCNGQQWTTRNKLMPPSIISVSFRYLHYFWWMTSVSRWVSLQLPQLRFKLLPLEDSVTLSMTCCFSRQVASSDVLLTALRALPVPDSRCLDPQWFTFCVPLPRWIISVDSVDMLSKPSGV